MNKFDIWSVGWIGLDLVNDLDWIGWNEFDSWIRMAGWGQMDWL